MNQTINIQIPTSTSKPQTQHIYLKTIIAKKLKKEQFKFNAQFKD